MRSRGNRPAGRRRVLGTAAAAAVAAALTCGTAASGTATAGTTPGGAGTGTVAALTGLARSYLADRAAGVTEHPPGNRVLGADTARLGAYSGTLRASLVREAPAAARFVRLNRGDGAFTGASVRLVRPSVEVTGDRATMTVTERTRLAYTGAGFNRGRYASYQVDHRLTFVRSGSGWTVDGDRLALAKGAPEPLPYFGRSLAAGGRKSGGASRTMPGAKPSSYRPGDVLTTPRPPRTSERASYNRAVARDYAYQWVNSRNGAYPRYGNDCANFVSQALFAGGWTSEGYPGNDRDSWWRQDAGGGFFDVSASWPLSQGLADYGFQTSNRFRTYAGEPAAVGDVVFADWQFADGSYGHDGHVDHTMIVTAIPDPQNWAGILMTYHTNDTKDISMAAVVEKQAASQGSTDYGQQVFYFADPTGHA